jgi:hypothetical protein
MQVRSTPIAPALHASPTTTAAITTPVAWIFHVVVVRRLSLLSCHRSATSKRQYDEKRSEPSMQVHCAEIGSIRLGSLFLTLPTRVLTGQHDILLCRI